MTGAASSPTPPAASAQPPQTSFPAGPAGGAGNLGGSYGSDWRYAGQRGGWFNPTTGQFQAGSPNQPPPPSSTPGTPPPSGTSSFDNATYLGRERIAQMDPNERRAYELANGPQASAWMSDLDKSRQYAEEAAKPFTSFDVNAYMNPYIKGALDPAARELRLETQQNVNAAGQQSAMAGAFGGSRGTLLETEARRAGTQAVGDLYSRGYAQAFTNAQDQINNDRNAAARAAEQFRATGSQGQAQLAQQMQQLMTTGGLARSIKQAGIDFDYSQFLENRDWDVTNLGPLLASLNVPYTSQTTTTAKKSALQTIAGIGMTVVGGFMMNPGLIGAGIETAFGDKGTPQGVAPSGTGQGLGQALQMWNTDRTIKQAGGMSASGPYSSPDDTSPGSIYRPSSFVTNPFGGTTYTPAMVA